jgi:hypothetical protein
MFPGRKSLIRLVLAGAVGVAWGTTASAAGLLGGGLSLGGLAGSTGLPLGRPLSGLPTGTIGQPLNGVPNGLPSNLNLTVDSVGRPTESHSFERTGLGDRIIRGEILAVAPSESDLAAAQQLKFSVGSQDTLDSLGLVTVRLLAPEGMSAAEALAALRASDPAGNFDFDHIYDPSGEESAPGSGSPELPAAGDAGALVVGMIDAGIDKKHPAFASEEIVAGNVTGSEDAPATPHGTAVASLLVGRDGDFHGQLPGAKLYAADVFGGQATGGSALDIARALNWLAQNNVAVVNASLAGPPNALLAAAVKAFVARGHVLVAAVGNEGPAAPLAYPAAYDGVVGVTSVDANRHLQLDANRGNVVFAALGVDVRAATLKNRYATFTGTSFAAPVVAARFAQMVRAPDAQAAQTARTELARAALRLGGQSAYGYGYVAPVEIAPMAAH